MFYSNPSIHLTQRPTDHHLGMSGDLCLVRNMNPLDSRPVLYRPYHPGNFHQPRTFRTLQSPNSGSQPHTQDCNSPYINRPYIRCRSSTIYPRSTQHSKSIRHLGYRRHDYMGHSNLWPRLRRHRPSHHQRRQTSGTVVVHHHRSDNNGPPDNRH